MDYFWIKNSQGQFVNGHEQDDVVSYQNNVFIPVIKRFEATKHVWTVEDVAVEGPPPSHHTVTWWHDESTFYTNACRKIHWVHKGKTAVPYAKGEGASQMVADFVSADYGWLKLPDGKEQAHVLFKAGKACQGYFTNDDILNHASTAMDILEHTTLMKIMSLYLTMPLPTSNKLMMPCQPEKCPRTSQRTTKTGVWR